MRKLAFVLVWLLLFIPCQAQAACDTNIPGDITGDCNVVFDDFAMLASDWLEAGQPHEWIAIYDVPDNSYNRGNAIAIDSNDNIYVSGHIASVYTTIKYAPDSNQPLWVARDSSGQALAIAIDSNDNIYVTGGSTGSGTYNDYATIKYAPDSNQPIWVARYNGPGNSHDVALAIALDSNDNIYVTGYSKGSGTGDDYATIKYSPDSNQPLWVARYNGPANSHDWALAIAVDSNDNIYVTGYSYGSGTANDYTTIKYSPDSNQPLWVARYNGPGNSYDRAFAITVDSNDNIYVTGSSYGSGPYDDYATIKYSPDSNLPVWIARYNGPGNNADGAEDIAVDSNDNIYVTGSSYGSGTGDDCATIKYSPDSNLPVWVARYNGSGNSQDMALAIAVDSNENIYVTGSTVSGTGQNYATIKYSPDSNQPLWVARYSFPDPDLYYAWAIAVDSNDNIYVTGGRWAVGPYATVKYSPDYTCTPSVIGDLNHDCEVDIYDLNIFCRHWLESSP